MYTRMLWFVLYFRNNADYSFHWNTENIIHKKRATVHKLCFEEKRFLICVQVASLACPYSAGTRNVEQNDSERKLYKINSKYQ